MSFMPISYITIFLPISLAAVVTVMYEMGINDISTYPSLHTQHFLKMFLDLYNTWCIYERYNFQKRQQEDNETIDQYVTALRTLNCSHMLVWNRCR